MDENQPFVSETEVTAGAQKFYLKDGILYITFIPNVEEKIEDARLALEKMKELYGEKKYPIFVDNNNVKPMSREVRSFHSSKEGSVMAKAIAVVSTTPLAKMIANFYLKINNPPYPLQIFNTKDEAVSWLQQFKD